MTEPTRSIYLDYNASTPIDPRVVAVMRPLLDAPFANPSASHAAGRAAKATSIGRAPRSPASSAVTRMRSCSRAAEAKRTTSP